MSIWIEFRCENRGNASSWATKPGGDDCESHTNAGPAEMAGDTQESVIFTLRHMGDIAKKNGWKKTQYGWICAYCAEQKNVMNELAAEAV